MDTFFYVLNIQWAYFYCSTRNVRNSVFAGLKKEQLCFRSTNLCALVTSVVIDM